MYISLHTCPHSFLPSWSHVHSSFSVHCSFILSSGLRSPLFALPSPTGLTSRPSSAHHLVRDSPSAVALWDSCARSGGGGGGIYDADAVDEDAVEEDAVDQFAFIVVTTKDFLFIRQTTTTMARMTRMAPTTPPTIGPMEEASPPPLACVTAIAVTATPDAARTAVSAVCVSGVAKLLLMLATEMGVESSATVICTVIVTSEPDCSRLPSAAARALTMTLMS